MRKLIGRYRNGNYTVTIFDDGTKIRDNDLDNLTPDFAENCDVTITTRCDGGCSFCLKSNAMVVTPHGDVAISELREGDMVMSYDGDRKSNIPKPVTHLFNHYYSGDMMRIVTEDGKTIVCTPNHKIFTQRGYICADQLTTEDEVIVID